MLRWILNCAVYPAAEGWAYTTFRHELPVIPCPLEGQLVVFLALTGQMSHNRVWLGKCNPSVHSRASQNPVMPCTTDRTDIPKPARRPHGTVRFPQNWTYGCSHARMESTMGPRVLAREPYGTFKVHVRYLATPWPNNTQITHRTPEGMWAQHRVIPMSGPGP